jgi:hypothetical protein
MTHGSHNSVPSLVITMLNELRWPMGPRLASWAPSALSDRKQFIGLPRDPPCTLHANESQLFRRALTYIPAKFANCLLRPPPLPLHLYAFVLFDLATMPSLGASRNTGAGSLGEDLGSHYLSLANRNMLFRDIGGQLRFLRIRLPTSGMSSHF